MSTKYQYSTALLANVEATSSHGTYHIMTMVPNILPYALFQNCLTYNGYILNNTGRHAINIMLSMTDLIVSCRFIGGISIMPVCGFSSPETREYHLGDNFLGGTPVVGIPYVPCLSRMPRTQR